MTAPPVAFDDLVRAIRALPAGPRQLVALAGPPGSGKSVLATRLAAALGARGRSVRVVPMDGFHLDNAQLRDRDLMSRKGAPESFDLGGLRRLLRALHSEDEVVFPVFDRTRDIAIAGAGLVPAGCDLVIVEGNYLLLDEPGWRDLAPLWNMAIRLTVPRDVLRQRLIARWLDHGLPPDTATRRAEGNDLANADRIARHALPADLEHHTSGAERGAA